MDSMESVGSIFNKPLIIGGCTILVVVSLTNFFISDAESIFSLISVNTMISHTYVWNLVTSHFFEINWIKLILELMATFYFTRNVTIPSTDQFGLYCIVCVLGSSGASSFTCFIRFFASRMEESLVTPIYGFGGILITILLFTRQQLKGQNPIESIPVLTYHNLPIVIILSQFLILLLGYPSLVSDLPLSCYSLLLGWSYLRFFYRFHPDSDVLGDNSEDFSFVAMFPKALQPFVVPLTTAFYNIGAMIGLFPELEVVEKKPHHHLRYTDLTTSSNSPALLEAGLSGNGSGYAVAAADVIQERRRAKAMKLLDAKMAELSTEPDGWDDKEDETVLPSTLSSSALQDPMSAAVTSKRPSSSELSHMKI